MAADFIIQGGVNGPDIQRQIERAIQAGVTNGQKNTIKLKVDGSNLRQISEPLGHMARNASEFNKSLEASTARVLAFGATVGVVYNVQRAFKTMVADAIEVEKAMADINSVFGLTEKQLESFSAKVFQTARNTGASFKDTAEAALELSRQGLSAAETTKRLSDAMILARLSGLSGKDSVEALTGAINSFGKEVLTSTQIVNKFSNVATQFSVSEADFAEAIKRVGSSAEDAGVDMDHLIGLITSLKQTTQRDGAVIGTSLKSIFTRLQKSDTVEKLEEMGVAMRNLDGSARTADQILQSLAKTYVKLDDGQKSYVSGLAGGMFQVNQLKAAMSDLNKEYSVNARAVKVSSEATDQAIKRNETLNATIAAQLNALGLQGKQAGAKIGNTLVQKPLAAISDFSNSVIGKEGDGVGVSIGEGIARGIGAALTGPAGAAIIVILSALVKKTASYAIDAAKALVPLNKEEKERLLIAENIDKILQHQGLSYEGIVKGANSATEANMRLLKVVEQFQGQAFVNNSQKMVSAEFLQKSYSAGGSVGNSNLSRRGASPGLRNTLPNFADPLREAIDREKASGVPESSIYVDRDARLQSATNPQGIAVANRVDEPLGVWQGVNREMGRGGGKGIPNFATGDQFVEMIKGMWPRNPFDKHEVVVGKATVGVGYADSKSVWLNSLHSLEKGAGHGTKALKTITELADKEGVAIKLHAKPYLPGGLDKGTLRSWYERNGFYRVASRDKNETYMERQPGGASMVPNFANLNRGKITGGIPNFASESSQNPGYAAYLESVYHKGDTSAGEWEGFVEEVQAKSIRAKNQPRNPNGTFMSAEAAATQQRAAEALRQQEELAKSVNQALAKYRESLETGSKVTKELARIMIRELPISKDEKAIRKASVEQEVINAKQVATQQAAQAVQQAVQNVVIRRNGGGAETNIPTMPEVLTGNRGETTPFHGGEQFAAQTRELEIKRRLKIYSQSQEEGFLKENIETKIAQGGAFSSAEKRVITKMARDSALKATRELFPDMSGAEIAGSPSATKFFRNAKKSFSDEIYGTNEYKSAESAIGQHFTQNQGNIFGSESRDLKAIETKLGRRLSEQEKQNIFAPSSAQASSNRRGALQSTALNASLIGSFALGALPDSLQGRGTAIAQGGLTGLSIASLLGSVIPKLAGPYGLAASTVAGAGLAGVNYASEAPKRELEKLSKEYGELKSKIDSNNQAASNYITTQEKLNDLLASGAQKEGDIDALNAQLTEFFNTITDPKLRSAIAAAGNNVQKQEKIVYDSTIQGSQELKNRGVEVAAASALNNRVSRTDLFMAGAKNSHPLLGAVLALSGLTGSLKKDDTSGIINQMASSIGPNFKTDDLGRMKETLKGLRTANPEGVKAALRSLNGGENTDRIVDNDTLAGIKLFSNAIKQIGENLQRSETAKNLQETAKGLFQLDKNLRERLSQSLLQQEIMGSSRLSKESIQTTGAKGRLQSASYGLTESALLSGEQKISRSEFQNELNTGRDKLRDEGLKALTDLVENKLDKNSVSQRKIASFLTSRPGKEFSLNEVQNYIGSLGDKINKNDFSDKTGMDSKGILPNLQTGFGAKAAFLKNEEDAKIAAFKEGQNSQSEALLYKNRVAALGGPNLGAGPIDFTAIRAGAGASLTALRGQQYINNPALFGNRMSDITPYGRNKQDTFLRATTQPFRVTEGLGILDQIKILGPELGKTLATEGNRNKIEQALLYKNKSNLENLTKQQIGGTLDEAFATGGREGGPKGGLDKNGLGGRLLKDLKDNVNRNNGNIDYAGLMRIVNHYGSQPTLANNPTINHLKDILRTGNDAQKGLAGASHAQAQDLIKTGGVPDLGLSKIGENFESGAKQAVNIFQQGFSDIVSKFSKDLVLTSYQKVDASVNITLDSIKILTGDVTGLTDLISKMVKQGIEESKRPIPLPPRNNPEGKVIGGPSSV